MEVVELGELINQSVGEFSEKLFEADIVIGNRKRADILEYINAYLKDKERIIDVTDYEKDDIMACRRMHDNDDASPRDRLDGIKPIFR